MSRFIHRIFCALLLSSILIGIPKAKVVAEEISSRTALRMVVMDPLAAPLSCACVDGVGQRDYNVLQKHLQNKLQRPVKILFAESLQLPEVKQFGSPDLIIGKQSVVKFDAKKVHLSIQAIACLTDRTGSTMISGVALVRTKDKIESLDALSGKRLAIGPVEDNELHSAAIRFYQSHKLEQEENLYIADSIEGGVYALADNETDVAFVPKYMPPLLEGCGKIEPGSVKVIGETEPVSFITCFVTETQANQYTQAIKNALASFGKSAKRLNALESKEGFVLKNTPIQSIDSNWTDWRGPNREGLSKNIPRTWPAQPKIVWKAKVTGPALAGIAADERHVIVPDKDKALKNDVFRCFDAKTGEELWQIKYPAEKFIDYTNAPRATPVFWKDLVFLQGALGDLLCVERASGKIQWQRNLVKELKTDLVEWGTAVPPLIVDNLLITNPGAKDASLVALDAATGEIVWRTPGHASAYAAFRIATFNGVRQIIGYDSASIGGWNLKTGQRLWELVPPDGADFNVTTPLLLPDGLLLATENNATRRYLMVDGIPKPKLIASNIELAPDTCTPAMINQRLFASAYGELFCLDLTNNLKTIWKKQDDLYFDHTNIIAGNNRLLIWTSTADLLLVPTDTDDYQQLFRWQPFGDHAESMSHPAITNNRLYLRDSTTLICVELPNIQ
ncbi:MAG: outer membrane protein assembly factor BamB family protein [Pirellulales bacterium]